MKNMEIKNFPLEERIKELEECQSQSALIYTTLQIIIENIEIFDFGVRKKVNKKMIKCLESATEFIPDHLVPPK
jgi:hypothetical protein